MLSALVISGVGWLLAAMVFEGAYQKLGAKLTSKLPKHHWCWLWWSGLGVLAFATGGTGGLVQGGIIFVIAAGHISSCGVKEDVISPVEIVRNVPAALREVYARFRRLLQERNGP